MQQLMFYNNCHQRRIDNARDLDTLRISRKKLIILFQIFVKNKLFSGEKVSLGLHFEARGP